MPDPSAANVRFLARDADCRRTVAEATFALDRGGNYPQSESFV
jgi:hypothetical protein